MACGKALWGKGEGGIKVLLFYSLVIVTDVTVGHRFYIDVVV